jgi:NADH dehydrogenase FAD-containing subunit
VKSVAEALYLRDHVLEQLELAALDDVADSAAARRNHPDVFAAGDAAAVPDVTHPGSITPPTAQHAIRQGKVLANNVAASLGYGKKRD